ncbi:hypothetical protein QTP88_019230 [Uroleucon formosanum]
MWAKLKNVVMKESNNQKWIDISNEFEKNAKFPNCIGALDGKHIRMIQPPDSGSIYYNYKHFFSLVLMALCDSNYCFVWIDIGGFGKDSDSGIYKESSLYKKLTEKKLDLPDPRPITNNGDIRVPYVIVADEAFGMSENLMRPYGVKKKRSDNNSFLTVDEYNIRIEELKHSKFVLKTPGEKKSMKDYRMVRKYDILTINNKERLIKPVHDDTILYYVTIDELFNILHSTHSTIGHGGRCRMDFELKSKYCNITNETIMAYLNLYTHCQKKSSNPKRGLVSKPILHSTFNSRSQIDLIDMQSQHINGFRFILNYQDHLTKFVLLRALSSKRAEEIAHNFLDIYTTFGAPAILHSDNGREFVNSIIIELHSMWPDVKIVHGKPRHSQSQGSVERANRDVEDMQTTWMAQNKSKDWPSAGPDLEEWRPRGIKGVGAPKLFYK